MQQRWINVKLAVDVRLNKSLAVVRGRDSEQEEEAIDLHTTTKW